MWYVYECHLSGDYYISDKELSYEERYCEQCGDSDRLMDSFDTEEEAENYIVSLNNGEFEDDEEE